MSSDSEDDCYGNIAQKLNSIKSKYTDDKIKTTNILGDTPTNAVSSISSQNAETPVVIDLASAGAGPTEDHNSTFNSLDGDDNILDQIIATNTKKRGRKSKTITSDISVSNILPERASRRKRGRASTTKPDVSQNISTNDTNTSIETPNLTLNESVISDSSVSTVNNTRGSRGAKRGRRGRGAGATSPRTQPPVPTNVTAPSNTSTNTTINSPSGATSTNTTLNNSRGSSRGRRGRGRGTTTPRRPRHRRRNYGWFSSRRYNPFTSIFDEDDDEPTNSSVAALLNALASAGQPSNSNTSNYPTYSVGNTYEYPDESHGQQLFQKKPAPSKDIEIIENDEDTEIDNEELSVKVYWQNLEYVKFNIRKYQKLSQIFDHFAKRENVTHDKLFFTFNDRILKSTDTPDSIGYNIAKFIDGGIVKQNVSQLVKDSDEIKDGITLKFQCQTKKTPFVTNIKKDDKLYVAMMKCAENLDQPVSKLKFYFDGDLLSGKSTAEELELEGGECIDVKIIS